MMVPDMSGGRELQLAHLLYALRRALDRLRTYAPIPKVGVLYLMGIPYRKINSQSQNTISPNQYPRSTPRIYEAFMIENGTKEMLTFQSQLRQHHAKAMLFLATSQGSKFPDPKLVKLTSPRYGTNVHRVLAAKGFAPTLYGSQELVGAPTAYVMEYLPPPSLGRSGWITLYALRQHDNHIGHQVGIKTALDQILEIMAAEGVVHGDLRSPNFMIKVRDNRPEVGDDGKYYIQVIDFDWAGESGKVRYPLYRNSQVTWPAPRDAPILPQHDVATVEDWWVEERWF
jgi:hypothetical protein